MGHDQEKQRFPVVALGASAGGLESLGRFLRTVPDEGGAAYVVVTHMDPNRESQLPELLQAHTRIPVTQVEAGLRLAPDRVYVAPPGKAIMLEEDAFRVAPREAVGSYTIDAFFTSLAEHHEEWAVGVVLSGSGSDGTLGLQAIRAYAGFTVAEEPERAAYASMPRSAIEAGMVDLILPVEGMGEELLRRFDIHLGLHDEGDDRHLSRILTRLRRSTGCDFRLYRRSMVRRRIIRRQRITHSPGLEGYADRLSTDEAEVRRLFQDLLITVTRFFRDEDAFRVLAERTLPELLDRVDPTVGLRAWVVGCSSGEEAYSLAILVAEELDRRRLDLPVQIFATDLDEQAISRARRGVYPEAVESQLSAERRELFFARGSDGYRIGKRIREMVVLSTHDITCDPPFSRLDLVTCRNLLIYFTPEAQRRVLSVFHYALRPGGTLFLGRSETVGKADTLFVPVDEGVRLFRRLPGPSQPVAAGGGGRTGAETADRPSGGGTRTSRSELDVPGRAERVLLETYAPPAVLVDRKDRVTHFFGRTDRYLSPPQGAADLDVTRMARGLLSTPIRRVLHQLRTGQVDAEGRAVSGFIRLPTDSDGKEAVPEEAVRVVGRFLQSKDHEHPALALLSFETREPPRPGGPAGMRELLTDTDPMVRALQEELRFAREDLQATIEELEMANEELRATNEELLSMNEELQSTNEELETSKEELVSVNEELQIVNTELQERVTERSGINADLQNLMNSTRIPTMFLDRELRIKQFTPAASEVFRLIPTDRGRPLTDIASRLSIRSSELEVYIQRVLGDQERVDVEVKGVEGEIYSLRIHPYRTLDGEMDGVVMTLTDVTHLRRVESRLRRVAESIQQFPFPFILVDEDWSITDWNRGAELVYGYTAEDMVGRNYLELIPPKLRDEERARLERQRDGEPGEAAESTRRDREGRVFPVWSEVSRVRDGASHLIMIADRDVTEQARAERYRELLVRELDHRVKNTLAIVEGVLGQCMAAGAESVDAFARSFRDRIRSLAAAHRAMASGGWEGASLQELVDYTVLTEFGERIDVEGDDVVLPEFVVSPLAMALHELLTNAVRHGALSEPDGRVRVEWSLDAAAQEVRFVWTERDGPPVEPPSTLGFGTRLLQEGIPYEIGGTATVTFREEGVQCEMVLPLSRRED